MAKSGLVTAGMRLERLARGPQGVKGSLAYSLASHQTVPRPSEACWKGERMIRLLLMMAAMAAGLCAVHADAGQKRPFRGAVGISVLLCKYKDAPAPAKSRQFYEDMMINKNKGAHADYWRDVSNGSITLKGSVVKGWYTLGPPLGYWTLG